MDDFPQTDNLTIKIDVEGVLPTLAVLKGAHRLARERRPVMMVEYPQGPADALHQFLTDLSYSSVVCKPNGTGFIETRMQPDQLNHFFVPSEMLQKFVKAIGP